MDEHPFSLWLYYIIEKRRILFYNISQKLSRMWHRLGKTPCGLESDIQKNNNLRYNEGIIP